MIVSLDGREVFTIVVIKNAMHGLISSWQGSLGSDQGVGGRLIKTPAALARH